MNYTELRTTDCTGKVEKKGRFSYLSWAFALDEMRVRCPDARWRIVRGADGQLLHPVGDNTHMVCTEIEDESGIFPMWLPVINHSNKPIVKANSMDVNTAIMRCLVKNIGVYCGIGLHLYAGEDLPPKEGVEEQDLLQFQKKVGQSFSCYSDVDGLKDDAGQFKAEAEELGLTDWLYDEFNRTKEAIDMDNRGSNS